MRPCGRCKTAYGDDEYPVRDKNGRRHTICRSCRREYCRLYARRHRVEYNARKRVRSAVHRARNRRILDDYLRSHPCVDCGIDDPLVLEFDHVRGRKHKEVTVLAREAARVEVLLAEIGKCVVRCANCRRRRTAVTLWGRRQEICANAEIEKRSVSR